MNKLILYISLVVILLCSSMGWAQTDPDAQFTVKAEVCKNESIQLTNQSVNASSYLWDFCSGDFDATPAIEGYINSASLSTVNNITVYQDSPFSTEKFVFVPSGGGKEVYRYKANDDFSGTPVLEAVFGNTLTLSRPIDIDIIKIGGNYFGYLVDLNDNKLYEINFGASLSNAPIEISDLGGFSSLNMPIGVKAVKDEGVLKLLVSNFNATYLTLLTRGADGVFTPENISTGLSYGGDVDVIKFKSKWIATVGFAGSGLVKFFDFGGVLTSTVSSTFNYSPAGIGSPENVKFAVESGELNAIAQSNSGSLSRINFGADYNTTPVFQSYGNLGILNSNTRGLDIANNSKSEWYALIVQTDQIVNKINFVNNCAVGTGLSTEENPIISYSASGTYNVNLSAYNEIGNSSSLTKPITVTANEAPQGVINILNAYCIANEILFEFNTQDSIINYLWDLGGEATSIDPTPSFTFTSAGSYLISLSVESAAGCANTFQKIITIYEEPVPTFSTTSDTYCSFEEIAFENTTTGNFDSVVEWQWDFNGEGTSTEKSPSFTFESAGTKTISLTANVLGCVVTVTKQLNIISGPKVAFTYANACLGTEAQFTDETTGENITSYLWDFGNGQTSVLQNPVTIYDVAGTYTVKLTVTNSNGCKGVLEKDINIYSQIIEDIQVGQIVENISFSPLLTYINNQAFDITFYQWELNGEISNEANPGFVVSEPGSYMLNVSLETAGGCWFTYQKEIIVEEAVFPTVQFDLPAEVCINESIQFTNQSVNGSSYLWDFCVGDFNEVPAIEGYINSSSLSTVNNITIYQDLPFSAEKFVFVPSGGGKEVYRYKANDDFSGTPVLEAVFGNALTLNRPIDIDIIKIGENYFGYLVDLNDNKLYEINFGASLSNAPIEISDLGGFSSLNMPIGVKAVNDEGVLKLLVSNFNATYLTLLTQGNDGSFTPENISTGLQYGGDVDIIKYKSKWIATVGYSGSGLVKFFDFGEILTSTVASTFNYSPAGIGSPENVKFAVESGELNAIAQSNSGSLSRINFGADYNTNPSFQSYGSLGVLNSSTRGLDIANNSKSEWYALIVQTDQIVNKINFVNNCAVGTGLSTEENLIISYSASGTYNVNLTAYNAIGNSSSLTKPITVTANEAPQLQIYQGENQCISNPITLTAENLTPTQTISSYTWTFPDGSQQTTEEASYQFTEPGTYNIRLRVESDNGCGNFAQKQVTIYPEPQAAYSLSADLVCSNAPITFNNETGFPEEEVISYLWDFGDGNTSEELSPEHTFQEAGIYEVNLTASIPGCSSTTTQSIEIQAGPETLFEAAHGCDVERIVFDNQTTGDDIVSWAWDLGDGTFSSLQDPEHTYDAPGSYMVLLKATNALGCETSFTQELNVYSLPEADFEYSPACAGNQVDFQDESRDADGNIVGWEWSFLQPNGSIITSNEQNPTISWEQAGSYLVSLRATTTWGCESLVEKTVLVVDVPAVEIGFGGACEGEQAAFADLTETNGQPVQSWYWQVDEQVFTDQAFNYAFDEAGTYLVSLQLNLQNGCSVSGSREVTVNSLPEVEFTFTGTCVGEVALLEAMLPAEGDGEMLYSWTIEDKVYASEDHTLQHKFTKEGSYAVGLTVEDENGCQRTITKEIMVEQGPVAAFTADRFRGVAPFTVNFTNESQDAVAYQWFFNDQQGSRSSEAQPSFTFTETGEYEVRLLATNEAGCTASTIHTISVPDASYDVALNSLHLLREEGKLQLVLGLENAGTILVTNMEIEVLINNEYSLSENFTDTLEIGQQLNYPLKMQLNSSASKKIQIVCVRLKPKVTLVERELNKENNERCLSLEQQFIMQEPFPNPGKDKVQLRFVLPDAGGRVDLKVYSALGGLVSQTALRNLQGGFSQHELQIGALSSGVYFLHARFGGEEQRFRIVKQ